jgi:predicted permease
MNWLRFFRRRRRDEDLALEIESYLEHETDERIAAGSSREEARFRAARKLGNRTAVREAVYDMNSMTIAEGVWKDFRFAIRQLRLNPLFSFAAITSLALGIGANTSIFQLLDAVRLRTLPVTRPDELVAIRILGEGRHGNFRGRNSQFTNSIWQELQQRQHGFAGVLAWGDTPLNLAPAGEVRSVEGLWVSGSFFSVLGVRPHLGRLLAPQDDRRGCGWPGVVISHAFWLREFGGSPDVLRQSLRIAERAVPILGVTPPEFFGVEVGRRFDVAMPICSADVQNLNDRMFWFLSVMGRRAPGSTDESARVALASLSRGIFEATVPPFSPGDQRKYMQMRLDMEPAGTGQSSLREVYQRPLAVLLGMVGFVLLVACANLANMMLARAAAREQEFALRLSIGASRARLARQLLTESLLLVLVGGGLGIAVAPVLSGFAVTLLNTARDPIYLSLDGNWRVLAFTAAISCVTCLLFGLAPALRAGGARLVSGLDARSTTGSRGRFTLRRVLLVAQVAFSMVLLTGALLFSRSFRNLLTLDPGFRQEGLLIANTFFRPAKYPPERRLAAYEQLRQQLAAIPGVAGAAHGYVVPISGSGWDQSARVSGSGGERRGPVNLTSISAGYFDVMGTPLLSGRDFTSNDRASSPPVAIVNEAFAKYFFDGANPVGRTFELPDGPVRRPPFEVVGLVRNTKYRTLQEEFTPIVYFASAQSDAQRLTVRYVLRTDGSPAMLMSPVKRVLAESDPELSVRFAVLRQQVEESLLRERLMATLAGFFGGLAAVVALLGVYSVTAYMVERRRREIGIRVALGSTRNGIVSMVLREVTVLMAAGLAAGVGLALLAGRAATTLLYGVEAKDAATLTFALTSLGLAGLLAALVPALRASGVAPIEALREQ